MQADPTVGVFTGYRYRTACHYGADAYCTPTSLYWGVCTKHTDLFCKGVEETRMCLHAQSSQSLIFTPLRVGNSWNLAPVLLSYHGRGHYSGG